LNNTTFFSTLSTKYTQENIEIKPYNIGCFSHILNIVVNTILSNYISNLEIEEYLEKYSNNTTSKEDNIAITLKSKLLYYYYYILNL
jgi:hypothetical protein